LEKDPFSNYLAEHDKGTVAKGIVQSVDPKGAVVVLADGIEGYIRASELSREMVDDVRKVLKEGEEIEAMITGFDRKKRSITLSVKAKENEEEAVALQEYSSDATAGTTKLGDILKQQLDNQE